MVAGTAKVTIDGDIKLLGENESIYIPLGATPVSYTHLTLPTSDLV